MSLTTFFISTARWQVLSVIFKNIPAKVDNKDAVTLRLVASAKNTQLEMTNFNSSFRKTGGANVKYVVNGKTSATANAKFHDAAGADNAVILYQITLSDWFTANPMDTNDDGLLNRARMPVPN